MKPDNIQEELVGIIKEVLEDEDIEINPNDSLIRDLGMDSLDLLDLTFGIESKFRVSIGPKEISGSLADKYDEDEMIDEQGYLTELAVDELRKALPEVPVEKIKLPLRPNDIPYFLTVRIFARLVTDKLRLKNKLA